MVEDEGQVILIRQWGNFQIIVWQIKTEKLTTGLVNQHASFLVVELMPQECAVQGAGLEFMDRSGRRWQVRSSTFQLVAVHKTSQYSPLERGIDLTLALFLVII